MQLQLALLLSQISTPIFRRVCRTFIFLGRLFLVSCLFVCLFGGLFIGLFVGLSKRESQYGLQQIWAVCHELLRVITIRIMKIAITITITITVTVMVTVTVTVMVIVMITTKNNKYKRRQSNIRFVSAPI